MLWWLTGVAVCVFCWGFIWKKSLSMAGGILVGVFLAWLLSFSLKPYVTGMESIPVWLPPLPLTAIAILLLVWGVLVWVRGEEGLPKPKSNDSDHHH